jgi:hypothetical protein
MLQPIKSKTEFYAQVKEYVTDNIILIANKIRRIVYGFFCIDTYNDTITWVVEPCKIYKLSEDEYQIGTMRIKYVSDWVKRVGKCS